MNQSQREDSASELANDLMRILNSQLPEPIDPAVERLVRSRWRSKISEKLEELDRRHGA